MNYTDMLQSMQGQLIELYTNQEIRSLIRIWADDREGGLYLKLLSDPNFSLTYQEITDFNHFISELLTHKPYQYILGYAEFFSMRFKVNSSTLIPRPETEELVQWVLEHCKPKDRPLTVLDLGTGSGCIAIALAKHLPNAAVYAIDCSEKALECARENAKTNQVEVAFEQSDMRVYASKLKFDIIVSNPPYIRYIEKKYINKNVLLHEPHEALFVPDQDPLIFYQYIAKIAKVHLKPSGGVFLEVNEQFSDQVAHLFIPFAQVEFRSDVFGKPRMVAAFS